MKRFSRQVINLILLACYFSCSNTLLALNNVEFDQLFKNANAASSKLEKREALYSLLENELLTDNQKAQVLKNLGVNYARTNELEKAIKILERALPLTSNDAQRADIHRLLGMAHYYLNGHKQSLSYYALALEYHLASDNQIEAANLENNIALAFENANLRRVTKLAVIRGIQVMKHPPY